MIRRAGMSHIPQIVELHKKALSNDFLPKLGDEILTEYHRFFIEKNDVITVSLDKKVVGFLSLCTTPINYNKLIKNNLYKIFSKIFFQPSLWGESLWFIFSNRKKFGCPEISFIAVKPSYQGKGIGEQLLDFTCDYLVQRHYDCIVVKTDAKNLHTNNFYQKNHFKYIDYEQRFNRRLNIYIRSLRNTFTKL